MARLYLLLLLSLFTLSLRAEPIVFVQNRGQWSTAVQFRADIPGGHLYLTTDDRRCPALHYVFYDSKALDSHHTPGPATPNQPLTDQSRPDQSRSDAIPAHAVSVAFEGASPAARLAVNHPSAVVRSFFTGKTPVGNVPAFGEVIYHDLYPGIDLRLYAYYQTLKYEFIVRPGADPAIIRLAYRGADRLSIANERLVVETSVQTINESRPYSYVSQNGRAVEVAARWQLDADSTAPVRHVGFGFPNGYDRSQPLTIDPELVFVTYSGATADNWGMTATYDAEGNLYSGGIVFGPGFPATTGSFQTKFSGDLDAAILKFSPDGSRLLYATFLGGQSVDMPHSLIVNSKGELVIMGTTSSPDFPVTPGAFQTQTKLGTPFSYSFTTTTGQVYTNGSDLFVAKISADGRQLVASTFVGGTGKDGVGARRQSDTEADGIKLRNYGDDLRGEVIVGPDDDVYVASLTESVDFPMLPPDPALSASADAIVLQLSADLSRLRWGHRIQGNGVDKAHSLRLTASGGSLYVCGVTTSGNLPANADALKPKRENVTLVDAFVARFDNQQLTRLTYLGTDGEDIAYLMDLSPDGSPHIFGLTTGRYPVTTGTYQNAGSGQFIHALDANLSKTVFSTVVGSGRAGPDIAPTAFLVNECGNIYLSGWGGVVNVRNAYNLASSTFNLPVTPDAYKKTTNGSNFWVALLERGAKSLLYATFMGSDQLSRGDHVDGGTSRFTRQGVIYHAVCACGGTNFPTTARAWSKTNNSANCNNLAFKFDVDRLRAGFDTYRGSEKGVVTGCTPLTLTFQNTSVGGRRFEWLIEGKPISTDTGRVSYVFDKPGEYVVRLRAYNPLTCQRVDSVQQVIKINPANFQISPDTTICPDAAVTLRASGATRYVWSPADGLSSTTIASPIARPQQTTTYTVDMTNEFGCTARRSVTVRMDVSFRPDFSVQVGEDCNQPARLTFVNNTQNADRYVWQLGNGDSARTAIPENVRYPESGQYTVTLTAYRNGCFLSTTRTISVENLNAIPNVITPNNDGKNDVFNTGLSGAQLVLFNRWGRRIFEAAPYANNWGTGVANGVYYYLITTPMGTQCKGWVQVLE